MLDVQRQLLCRRDYGPGPSLSDPVHPRGASQAAVSPGLRSRPSLSVDAARALDTRLKVSPGLRSRPSLSAQQLFVRLFNFPSVAGTTVPAFVSGLHRAKFSYRVWCVAGTTVPAFVERSRSLPGCLSLRHVSPGLRSRPSLSEHHPFVPAFRQVRCRRDYGPGLR